MKKYYSKVITTLQVLADFITVSSSFLLGYYLYHFIFKNFGIGIGPQPFDLYLKLSLSAGIFFVIVFKIVGLYYKEVSILNIDEMKKIFKAILYGAMILIAISFYMKELHLSRLIISYSLIIMFFLIYIERIIFLNIHQRILTKGIGAYNILIYGTGETGRQLFKKLFQSPKLGLNPIGFIDDDIKKAHARLESLNYKKNPLLLGNLEDLPEIVKNNTINELFIAKPSLQSDKIIEIINICKSVGIKFSIVPNLFEMVIQKVKTKTIGGIPLITLKEPTYSPLNSIIKRIFDIFFSLIALILFSPIFLLAAILIKLDSKGPIFFTQTRVGKNGKEFTMYKFRTMFIDTQKYAESPKKSDDLRITRIGRWLRMTSIDELPQLINSLKGEMSIVGPRPEMPFIVEGYNELQRDRLNVKPGITGLWQISAERGSAIHENIEYDIYYIENQSFLLDIAIILRTIYSAIRGVGAY